MIRHRSAKFQQVLVYMDEPQVITLLSGKRETRLVAVAVPDESEEKSIFLATTVSDRDWIRYLSSVVDLRYLFAVPVARILYYFDLSNAKSDAIRMERFDGVVPEEHLPTARFFADNHTEEVDWNYEKASDPEQLYVDGEWELTDFGQFQQKFSDIYTFLISQERWRDQAANDNVKKRILNAFRQRPYQGGFSYVHLFKDLAENVPRSDQISLDKIRYASPGSVEMFGKDEIFTYLEKIIPNFLSNRDKLKKQYSEFYKYLSKNRFLRMRGEDYAYGDASEKYIFQNTQQLCEKMLAPDFETIKALSSDNALVCAKVVLAFYRRLDDASLYFAQGRVSYHE